MSDKKYESLKIENIVASGVIADSIDLVALSEKVKNCELNKKRFPGAVYRIADPDGVPDLFFGKDCTHRRS